jgi:DNA-binding response OmpR family regulator
LKDKVILVVDDEPDVLEVVEEELDMCIVHKAKDYKTALQFLAMYTYDVVVLDIMGVNGLQLLKNSVDNLKNLLEKVSKRFIGVGRLAYGLFE